MSIDRTPFYSGALLRSFDLNNMERDVLKGVGRVLQYLLGNTGVGVDGFAAAAQTVPNLTINLGSGLLAEETVVDASSWATLGADTTAVMQLGYAAAQVLSFSVSDLSSGQQKWALVQAAFNTVDQVRTGDPTGGVVPFYNATNPPVPLQGPDGEGGTLPTVRIAGVEVEVIYGSAAVAGSAIPPSPTTGWAPMYLILLSAAQTAITTGEILIAGPAAYTGTGFTSGYPYAPFVAGLLEQHHLGIPGTAPKINLETETQGVLGFTQLPVSNTAPQAISGTTITASYGIPIGYEGQVNPNGNVAGDVGDRYLNTITDLEYVCSSAGPASGAGQAVWTQIGISGQVVTVSSWGSPFSPTPGNNIYLCNTTGAVGPTFNLLATAAMDSTAVTIRNTGNVELTVNASTSPLEHIEGAGGALVTTINLMPGQAVKYAPSSGVNYQVS